MDQKLYEKRTKQQLIKALADQKRRMTELEAATNDCISSMEETFRSYQTQEILNKLLQIANGASYVDEDKNWEELHDSKIEALKSIVSESNGAPLLIAYNFIHDRERIKKQFKEAKGLDDQFDVEDQWNRGEIPQLVTHPASAGHGLNLQYGGNNVVWFGLNWSLELYQQFNARVYRQGQTKTVFVHHLICENTIDEVVMQSLNDKDVTQQSLMKALRQSF